VAVAGTITPGTVARRFATGTIPGVVAMGWGRAWPPSSSAGRHYVTRKKYQVKRKSKA